MFGFLESICEFLISLRVKPKQEWRMSKEELKALLKSSFPRAGAYLWDKWYYYVEHEDWGKILWDVQFGMPKYTKERFDCENFALLCNCRTSKRYKLNTMGVAVGQSPWGYHGFNLFVSRVDDEPRLYILEPQTMDIYTPEEDSGYDVDNVIIG